MDVHTRRLCKFLIGYDLIQPKQWNSDHGSPLAKKFHYIVHVKGNTEVRDKDATSISYWNGCQITISRCAEHQKAG
jgi:hypothetical protein